MSTAASVSLKLPIWLTLIRIELPDAFLDAAREDFRVGDEEVVADELAAGADLVGQQFPADPVLLGHTVFDRDDRIGVEPA